jgi:hypothetical protein
MLRSERIISGISLRISANAENPSSAARTGYPISVSTDDNDSRIEGSSSTISSLSFVQGIYYLTERILPILLKIAGNREVDSA